jgi:predicted nucleic acid-binding protein
MPNQIIIADTSCLIALSNIEQLDLLYKVYKNVTITPEVQNEYGQKLPNWISIEAVQDEKKISIFELELDKGESSAIALAIEKENSLLIIDEKKGRKIAKRMGLSITGILGVILKAKENNIIENAKPILDSLINEGFRISDKLLTKVLEKIGE